MNVVILTPDAVGSTLLQRTLTIQMLLSDFDKPVINLHELSNGIHSYYNYELQTSVLGKKMGPDIRFGYGYNQTLPDIVKILDSADHYKTSRLAHYHLLRRKDSSADQQYFYEYLNNNFFIISAKRRNLLDYGLSWVLRGVHKKLNVYSPIEKISTFFELYKDPITVDTETLLDHLSAYKSYIDWTKDFDVGSNYYYEDHLSKLEDYIHSLPVFSGRKKNTWSDTYNISFQDYNKCHKSLSDIGTVAMLPNNDIKLLQFEGAEKEKNVSDIILEHLPIEQKTFVEKHRQNYNKAHSSIGHMVKLGLLVSNIPIKKHTFAEKKFIIKNFNECVEVFNNWIINYPELGSPIDDGKLKLGFESDNSTWQVTE
jgi:hypothetical protein